MPTVREKRVYKLYMAAQEGKTERM
jgi:hypothetical protein